MTATTTIKVFGLREYDEVMLPVSDLADARGAIERIIAAMGNPNVTVANASLFVLRSALLENPQPGAFTSDEDAHYIARTVLVFASLSNDQKFDAARGNFITVEATFQSFACTIYGHDEEHKFRHDMLEVRKHHESYAGIFEPPSDKFGTPKTETIERKNGERVH
jgi:hypothetical protein